MAFARGNSRRTQTNRVLAEPLRSPTPILQQFGAQLGDFFGRHLSREVLSHVDTSRRESERPSHSLIDPERLSGVAALHRMVLNDLLMYGRKCVQVARDAAQLLEQGPDSLRRRTWSSGRFNTAALNDEHRPFFLEAADRAAHICRLKPFPNANILYGQSLPRCRRIARRRQHPLDRGVFLKVQFPDLRE